LDFISLKSGRYPRTLTDEKSSLLSFVKQRLESMPVFAPRPDLSGKLKLGRHQVGIGYG
jgi:hypothetical protein